MSDAPSLSLPPSLSLSLRVCLSQTTNAANASNWVSQTSSPYISHKQKIKKLKKREINIIENGPQLLALGARAFLFIQTKRENVEETGGKFDDDMNSEEKSTLSVVNLMSERGVPF